MGTCRSSKFFFNHLDNIFRILNNEKEVTQEIKSSNYRQSNVSKGLDNMEKAIHRTKKEVEIEELKFRINSESGAMTEVKATIGDLEREIKQLKSDVNEKVELLSEKDQSLGELREREMKARLQHEETQTRLDELTGQWKEAEKARKQERV